MAENYTKDLKESIYHDAVITALAIGYTVLGKTFINKNERSIYQKVRRRGQRKVVAISDFTKD